MSRNRNTLNSLVTRLSPEYSTPPITTPHVSICIRSVKLGYTWAEMVGGYESNCVMCCRGCETRGLVRYNRIKDLVVWGTR